MLLPRLLACTEIRPCVITCCTRARYHVCAGPAFTAVPGTRIHTPTSIHIIVTSSSQLQERAGGAAGSACILHREHTRALEAQLGGRAARPLAPQLKAHEGSGPIVLGSMVLGVVGGGGALLLPQQVPLVATCASSGGGSSREGGEAVRGAAAVGAVAEAEGHLAAVDGCTADGLLGCTLGACVRAYTRKSENARIEGNTEVTGPRS